MECGATLASGIIELVMANNGWQIWTTWIPGTFRVRVYKHTPEPLEAI